jgi:hypothetical protein
VPVADPSSVWIPKTIVIAKFQIAVNFYLFQAPPIYSSKGILAEGLGVRVGANLV